MMNRAIQFRGAPRQSNCTACSAIKNAAATSPLLRRRNAPSPSSRTIRTVNPGGQCQGAWCEVTKGGGDLASVPRRSMSRSGPTFSLGFGGPPGVAGRRAPVRQITARTGVNPGATVGARTTPPSRSSNCWWTETGWLCCATGDTPWPKCVAGGMTSPGSGGNNAPAPRLGARVSNPARTLNPAPQYVTKPAMRNVAMGRTARGLTGGGVQHGGSPFCVDSCYQRTKKDGSKEMCCESECEYYPEASACACNLDCWPLPPGGGGGGSGGCGTPGNPPCPPETQPGGPGVASTRFGGFTTRVGVAPRSPFYSNPMRGGAGSFASGGFRR